LQIRTRLVAVVSLLLLALCGCNSCNSKVENSFDAMAAMKKTRQVRISTYPPRLPFEYGKDTGVQGFDIDIGNEIAKDLNIEARWIKISGYDHLFEVLKNGETEIVISTVTPNPDLEKDFAFSQPYYSSSDGIARRKDNPDIKDLSSLSGKAVGVGEGRPGDLFMATQQTATDVTIVKYDYLDEALGALNRSEIDAVVGDYPVLAYSSYESFPNLIVIPTEMNKYTYAVAVRKNDTVLLESIEKTIARLEESGKIAEFEDEWFGDILDKAEEVRLEQEKEDALKKAPKNINVRINKRSGSFKMDRLDGYVLVLQGEGGEYESTPILTEGNRGRCRFTRPVPPGNYTLAMSIFQTTTSVEIQESPTDTLSMIINYVSDSAGIRIEVR
jgi:ABC-type amino acid transport substrate-binding protein